MARSRSGTRGRRGPRKPPRRDGAFGGGPVQVADPRERGPIELPATITVKELADLLAVNPADVIRELIERDLCDDQPADRSRHRVARLERARLRSRRGRAHERNRRRRRRRDEAVGEATKELLFEEDDPSLLQPRAHRHGHGSRRPRQDEPARRDPDDRGGGRRARRHHPAHRRERGRQGRQARRVPGHAGPRGVHRDARPRRASRTSRSSWWPR